MTKINGNYDNRLTWNVTGASKTEEAKANGKKDQKAESSNIYGANLRLGQDERASRQAMAGKDALKKIMDVFSGEKRVDKDLEASQENIDRHNEELKENMAMLNELDEKEAGLLDEYDVKDVEELSPMQRQEFDSRISDINKQKAEFYKKIYDIRKIVVGENSFIRAVHKDRLKHHEMVDAQKEAKEILEDASRDVVGMMVDDAVEQQDEYLEEIKEKAEEKAEEQKELQEQQNQTEAPSGEISKAAQKDILSAEADKMVAEHKMTYEDIKGITCDETV